MVLSKKSVRRSVVIPAGVAEEAAKYASREMKGNFNRLVVTALEEFSQRHREEALTRELGAMASDKALRRECRKIEREFAHSSSDGLEDIP